MDDLFYRTRIIIVLSEGEQQIQDLQINYFYKCDPRYREQVAKALGHIVDDIVKSGDLVALCHPG